MKILILGFGKAPGRYNPPSTHCENFISPGMGGHDIITFGYNEGVDIVLDPGDEIEVLLGKLPTGWMPDFCLMWLLEWNLIPRGIERAPFPTVAWIPDWDYNLPFLRTCGDAVDLILSHGEPDSEEVRAIIGSDKAMAFHAVGVIKEYFAARPKRIRDRKYDIVYTTWIDDSVQPGRSVWINNLCSLSGKYNVHIDRNLGYSEYIKLLNDAKLVLSYSRHSSIAVRVADACAQGAVVLDPGREIKKYFIPNEEYIPVTEKDFAEQIDRYLNDEKTLQEMSDRAYSKAVREFDAQKRFLDLFDFIACSLTCRSGIRKYREFSESEKAIRRGENYYYANYTGGPGVFFINMDSRLLELSIEEFDKAYSAEPGPRPLLNLVITKASLFRKKRVLKERAGELFTILENIIETYPSYAMAYYYLGLIHFHEKNYQKALTVFTRALEIFRNEDSIVDPWCLNLREDELFSTFMKRNINESLILLRKGKEAEAVAGIRRLYQAALLNYIASIEESEGHIYAALEHLIESLQLCTGTGQTMSSAGALLAALGYKEESIGMLTNAVAVSPLNIYYRINLIKHLYIFGRYREVVKEIGDTLKIVKTVTFLKDKSVLLNETINALTGLNKEAPHSHDMCREAMLNGYAEIIFGYLKKDPGNINLVMNTANMWSEIGRSDRIFQLVEDFMKHHFNPSDADVKAVLSQLYEELRKLSEDECRLYSQRLGNLRTGIEGLRIENAGCAI